MDDPRTGGRGLLGPPHASELLQQVRNSPSLTDATNAALATVRRAALDVLGRKRAHTAAGRKSAVLAALKHARAVLDDLIAALGG
jgi:hypothetical protein